MEYIHAKPYLYNQDEDDMGVEDEEEPMEDDLEEEEGAGEDEEL